MEVDKMLVTMEDGLQVFFDEENGTLVFKMILDGIICGNKVKRGSVKAVIGTPLTFIYGDNEPFETGTPIRDIYYR